MAIVPSKQVGASIATEPLITHVVATTAGTEYSHVLNDGVKQIILKVKDRTGNIQFAFTATESGTDFFPLGKNAIMGIDKIKFESKTLYFQADVDNTTLIILELI